MKRARSMPRLPLPRAVSQIPGSREGPLRPGTLTSREVPGGLGRLRGADPPGPVAGRLLLRRSPRPAPPEAATCLAMEGAAPRSASSGVPAAQRIARLRKPSPPRGARGGTGSEVRRTGGERWARPPSAGTGGAPGRMRRGASGSVPGRREDRGRDNSRKVRPTRSEEAEAGAGESSLRRPARGPRPEDAGASAAPHHPCTPPSARSRSAGSAPPGPVPSPVPNSRGGRAARPPTGANDRDEHRTRPVDAGPAR